MPVSRYLINRPMLLIFSLVAVMMATVPVRAEEKDLTRILEVIGTATIQGEAVEKAREASIANGLVTAVERAAADLLPLESMVRHFKTLNRVVYGQAAGFIQGYKVLTESKSGDKYRVMIQATVSIEKLKKELARSGVIQTQKTLPAILLITAAPNLLHAEPQDGWEVHAPLSRGDAAMAMAEKMRDKGFALIEPAGPAQRLEAESLGGGAPIDIPRALDFAARMKADVLILANAVVQKAQNRMGSDLRSYKCTLTARAFRVDTGREMASTARMAVTMNTDDAAGGRDVLATAGSLSGEALSSEVAAAWRKRVAKSAVVEIIVEGTGNLSNFVRIRNAINSIPGVNGVRTREMRPDAATILVEFQGNSKALAQALMLKTFDSFGINIREISPERLRIELIPG